MLNSARAAALPSIAPSTPAPPNHPHQGHAASMPLLGNGSSQGNLQFSPATCSISHVSISLSFQTLLVSQLNSHFPYCPLGLGNLTGTANSSMGTHRGLHLGLILSATPVALTVSTQHGGRPLLTSHTPDLPGSGEIQYLKVRTPSQTY